MKKILTITFGIIIILIGILQFFESLEGSGIIMIMAGITILIMQREITKLRGNRNK